MSPSERSSLDGFSRVVIWSEARKYPGPELTFGLPAWRINCGSQPTSRSAPVQTTRSARRTLAMRLGLASMTCTSCSALVPTSIEIASPASSCSSEPHSGSQANAANACARGATQTRSAARIKIYFFMSTACSEFVRAVRAEGDVVLQEQHVVDEAARDFVAAQLQTEEAELAVAPGEFHAVAHRVEAAAVRIAGPGPELVVAVAEVPSATQAIHGFEVGAATLADPGLGERGIGEIDRIEGRIVRHRRGDELAAPAVEEELAAHGDAAVLRIAVRRPFPRRVGEIQRFVAAEAVVGAVRARLEHRHPGEPRAVRADVAARVREQ